MIELSEYYNILDWNLISEHQTLSESFIKEYQDKVDWEWISRYQKLSKSFIRNFLYK
jgi:hypothetical protein